MSVPAMPRFDVEGTTLRHRLPGAGWLRAARGRHPVRAWAARLVGFLMLVTSVGAGAGLRPALAAGPCDPPVTNPIACENSLPGSDPLDWGTGSDPSIVGFSTNISVNKGATIGFKVNTDSRNYVLTIYRLGYYGGLGARQMASLTPSVPLPQRQPACLTQSTTGLIDCGNWAVSASWTVPASAVSGIYIVKLLRLDNPVGASSQITFVVRDDSSTSPLVFQTSDTTWQAYNQWGGNSLYGGNGPAPDGRAYKVSYNRPFNTEFIKPESWVFNAEYPMLRWLEANGYNVSYITGMDSDRLGGLIRNHRVFLSVGHDEYWSGAQRANVEAARNAGVNLAFFSGNEVFWKTRWEASIDGSGTPYRTLVTYKETHANAVIDPADPPTWTGTWRDPRFSPPADGGRPENALTGTFFKVNGTDYEPLKVSADEGKLRFWRNTSASRLAAGQTVSYTTGCNGCLIGYEWDSDVDNGVRPAGLFQMSTTSANVQGLLVDYGSTFQPGPATHHLTLYRHASGALVFGAGTVGWAYGLDDQSSVQPSLPDVNIQQATVNLLADMGAQPATLQPGLVAAAATTDVTPPTSTITSPVAGAGLPGGTPVTIAGTATDAGGGMVAGVEVSVDGGATWHPASGRGSWTYQWTPGLPGPVTIKSRAVDDSGNLEAPSAGVTVTVTAPNCPCSIWSSTASPATPSSSDSSAVELGVKFTSDVNGFISGVRFYKGSTNTGTHVGNLWTSTGTLLATATFAGETASGWQQVSFPSPVAITANTTYAASYHTNVGHYAQDQQFFATSGVDTFPLHAPSNSAAGGNGVFSYGAGSTFPDQTFNATNYWVDVVLTNTSGSTTPPTVISETPAPNATLVAPTTVVTATFNKPVTASSIVFGLKNGLGAAVGGTTTWDATSNTATFKPTAALAQGVTFTATVSGATDSTGAVMTPVSWSFTTYACPCSLFPATATPALISSGDASAVELGLKFKSDVAGSVTGVRFYKATNNTGTHTGHLWSASGTLLASVTFTSETASGWQRATFSTPVAISANTTYVVSYHTDTGNYSKDQGFFTSSGYDANPLHAPSDAAAGGNGVYVYGASAFPTSTYFATNYWVDVIFTTP